MFERFDAPASTVICLAYAEADRLRHDYVGAEHLLVAIAEQPGRGGALLAGVGLSADVVRAGLDELVARGALPSRWRNQTDLLASLGIELDAVRRAAEHSFGIDALSAASCRARRRSWLRHAPVLSVGPVNPLAGKALLTKRAFDLARQHADQLGAAEIGADHLLIGVLRDGQDAAGTGLSRRAKRMGAHLGLPRKGPSAVRMVVELAGLDLDLLHRLVLAELCPVP